MATTPSQLPVVLVYNDVIIDVDIWCRVAVL